MNQTNTNSGVPMYFLFAGDAYYPEGGMNDFVGQYDSFDEAVAAWKRLTAAGEHFDWYNIATLQNGKLVFAKADGEVK